MGIKAKLKKTAAALTAAAIAAASLFCGSVTAYAKESKMKLLKTPVENVLGTENFAYLGDDVYMTDNGFYRIGRQEMADWRASGKLKATRLKSDFKIPSNWEPVGCNFDIGDYMTIYGRGSNDIITSFSVIKNNSQNGSIDTYYTIKGAVGVAFYNEDKFRDYEKSPITWQATSYEGYTMTSFDVGADAVIYVTPPNGKDYSTVLEGFAGMMVVVDTDYLFLAITSGDTRYDPYSRSNISTYRLVGVDRKGNQHVLQEYDASYFYSVTCSGDGQGDGSQREFLFYLTSPGERSWRPYLYVDEKNKVIDMSSVLYDTSRKEYNGRSNVNGIISNMYSLKNNLAVIHYKPDGTIYDGAYGAFRLVDISSGKPVFKSKACKHIGYASSDGDIIYLETFDGEYLLADTKNLKEIATFDDITEYTGKYIAAEDNGSVFLADKKGNRVSEKLDGVSLSKWRLTDGLFCVDIFGDYYFVTYADNGEKPDKPTNVAASADGGSVKLTWKTSETALGYEILYSTSENGEYKTLKKIKNGSTDNLTVNGLQSGTTYYFVIRSYRSYKGKIIFSGKTKAVKFTFGASSAQTQPKPAVSGKTARLNIEWEEVFGSDGYVIYVSETNDRHFKSVKTINDGEVTAAELTGLKAGTVYFIKIRSFTMYHGERVFCETSEIIRVKT